MLKSYIYITQNKEYRYNVEEKSMIHWKMKCVNKSTICVQSEDIKWV